MNNSEPQCRICLDTSSYGPLIQPCKCTGTIGYMHEDCLKRWVIFKYHKIEGSSCDICHTSFRMTVEAETTCSCYPLSKASILLLLILVQIILFVIFYVLYHKFQESPELIFRIFISMLMVLCLVTSVLCQCIGYIYIQQEYLKKSTTKKWVIHNFRPKYRAFQMQFLSSV